MDAYATVDAAIDACVKANGSTLFTEWAGQPARFFYLPGIPPFECFQIAVEPPSGGKVIVLARGIDTNDDTEMEMEEKREGPVSSIDTLLNSAVETIRRWKERPQQPTE